MNHRLIALIVSLIVIFGVTSSVAQNSPGADQLTGSWMAQLFNEFQFRHFFHLDRADNGSLSGSSEIPARLLHSPLTNIRTNNDSLSFTIQGPGIPFEGVMNKLGTQIKGQLGREH